LPNCGSSFEDLRRDIEPGSLMSLKLGFVEKRRLRRAANAAIHISKPPDSRPAHCSLGGERLQLTDAEMDACFEDRRIEHHA
jgi:hypothetical protein